MRDCPGVIKEFVKIVQRYPEVYDSRVDSYRMRGNQNKAWLRIRNSVKNELQEECTPGELKMKWKGIRSSFNRYLGKLQNSLPCRKYYLYDTLRFLAPFVNPKSIPQTSTHTEFPTENETSVDWTAEFDDVDVKPNTNTLETGNTDQEIFVEEENKNTSSFGEENETNTSNAVEEIYVKGDEESVNGSSEDSSDLMQFFRSVIPDLKDFTPKEKRKFKMGVLGLIDVIEDERSKE